MKAFDEFMFKKILIIKFLASEIHRKVDAEIFESMETQRSDIIRHSSWNLPLDLLGNFKRYLFHFI